MSCSEATYAIMRWTRAVFFISALSHSVTSAQPLVPYQGEPLPLIVSARTTEPGSEAVTLENGRTDPFMPISSPRNTVLNGPAAWSVSRLSHLMFITSLGRNQWILARRVKSSSAPFRLGSNEELIISVQAVVLMDGSAFGSPYWLKRIADTRETTKNSIDRVISELRLAAFLDSRDDIVERVRNNRERSKQMASLQTSAQKGANELPYELVSRNLESPGAWKEHELAAEIEHLVEILTRWRQRIASARPMKLN